jgi:methylated-DNA-protein-cysteine methyltransferase-like protein
VGYALARVPGNDLEIPWQRVINAKGEISYSPFREGNDYLQRALLEREGVQFTPDDRVNLRLYGWRPEEEGGHTSL